MEKDCCRPNLEWNGSVSPAWPERPLGSPRDQKDSFSIHRKRTSLPFYNPWVQSVEEALPCTLT